jgi:hypothetical protein
MARILRDRIHGSVDFIMTKTDDIAVDDALRSLKVNGQRMTDVMFEKQQVARRTGIYCETDSEA